MTHAKNQAKAIRNRTKRARRLGDFPAPVQEPCHPSCIGVVLMNDRSEVQRCDSCKRFDSDTHAAAYLDALLVYAAEKGL